MSRTLDGMIANTDVPSGLEAQLESTVADLITSAANETFETWRQRDHDDVFMALAVAVWHAERNPPARSDGPGWLPAGRIRFAQARIQGRGSFPLLSQRRVCRSFDHCV
jgi:hypothetical protein